MSRRAAFPHTLACLYITCRAAFPHTLASLYYIGVCYKLGDKERSKESAYVLVGFLARPFVSFVSHIARYAPSSTDKSPSLRNQKSTQPNF